MLAIIDAASTDRPTFQFEIVELENGDAAQLALTLRRALAPSRIGDDGQDRGPAATAPRIVPDPRTNALIVGALPGEMAPVRALIERLDAKQ